MNEEGWCVLTNSLNLQAFAARGLLGPPDAFPKYYHDLGSKAGGLVLLKGSVSADMVEAVVGEADDLQPVLLRLADGVGPTSAEAAVVTRGVVPLGEVTDLVVPGEAAAEAIRSHPYADVRLQLPILVDEERFRGPHAAIPNAADTTPQTDYMRPDRLTGALVGVASMTAPHETHVDQLVDFLAGPIEAHPPWIAERETELFQLIRGFLMGLPPNARPPRRALDTLKKRIQEAGETLPSEATAYLERMKEILRGGGEPEQFKPGGLVTLKGLLVAWLRPSLERLLDWETEELGADDDTLRTASYFVGAMSCRSRIPVALRDEGLDTWLASKDAVAINRFLDIQEWPVEPPKPSAAWEKAEGGRKVSISAAGRLLWSRELPALTLAERLLSEGAIPEGAESEVLELLRERGWEDLLTTRLSDIGAFRVSPAGSHNVTITLDGWHEAAHIIDAEKLVERLGRAD